MKAQLLPPKFVIMLTIIMPLAFTGCNQGSSDSESSQPSTAELDERANLAGKAMQDFVDSMLHGTIGRPDANLLHVDFFLDLNGICRRHDRRYFFHVRDDDTRIFHG